MALTLAPATWTGVEDALPAAVLVALEPPMPPELLVAVAFEPPVDGEAELVAF